MFLILDFAITYFPSQKPFSTNSTLTHPKIVNKDASSVCFTTHVAVTVSLKKDMENKSKYCDTKAYARLFQS